MSTITFDPVADVCERISFAERLFLADIQAMPDAMLAATHGGATRCGYDFLFELTGMYAMFTRLLTTAGGQIDGPQGWVRAPQEFKNKAMAIAALQGALSEFRDSIQGYDGDVLGDTFDSPVGPFTPIGMANLAVWHTMYHSGQLNFIQTIHGDEGFHWA